MHAMYVHVAYLLRMLLLVENHLFDKFQSGFRGTEEGSVTITI